MDLFNNPMVNNALKGMSKEQLLEYKNIGEHLYGSTNFIDSNIVNKPSVAETIAYIEEGIKSGLLPIDLTEDEVIVLFEEYGEEWYKRYGFGKDDVPEPGLSIEMKKNLEKLVQNKIDNINKKNKNKNK